MEALRHRDDRACDRRVAFAFPGVADERLIELELVERQRRR
jgi:hypothetical protein